MTTKTSKIEFPSFSENTDRYFLELSNVPVFSMEEETQAFQEMEIREADTLLQLLSLKSFSEVALRDLIGSCKEKEIGARELKDAICKSEKGIFLPLIRLIRFSDSGREWLDRTLAKVFDQDFINTYGVDKKHYQNWTRKLRNSIEKVRQIKSKCIAANLRLVVHVVRKYSRMTQNMSLDDLIQEGNFGLIKAVDRFDVNRGYRFSTYAIWWIRANVKRAIQEKEHVVRAPSHLSNFTSHVNRSEAQFAAKYGRYPSFEELVEVSNLSSLKVHQVLLFRTKGSILSLDQVLSDGPNDHSGTLLDVIENTNNVPQDEMIHLSRNNKIISRLFSTLTPKESSILKWRFGFNDKDPLTLKEIGDLLGVSRERIRQIEEAALRKLKIRGMRDLLI